MCVGEDMLAALVSWLEMELGEDVSRKYVDYAMPCTASELTFSCELYCTPSPLYCKSASFSCWTIFVL